MLTILSRRKGVQNLSTALHAIWAALNKTVSIKPLSDFYTAVISIGVPFSTEEYERRKLRIFNQLNFFAILTGMIVPMVGLTESHLPAVAFVVASSPALVALLVLLCNHMGHFREGRLCFFILYPLMTSMAYGGNMDIGVELFFILYGVLSVFFMQRLSSVVFAFSFSMAFYLLVYVWGGDYSYQLKRENVTFYFLNHLLAVFFIFYGLYLIKRENAGYQYAILRRNRKLHRINGEIKKQKLEIAEKAALLQKQTAQLEELNALNNKLFSIISHDLKGPVYALRHLFQGIQENDVPAAEIKAMIPDVVNDLNYTTGLMDNLLQWARVQMQSGTVHPQVLDLNRIICDTMQLLRLQAEAKKISLNHKVEAGLYIHADKDMIQLVLRNLVSNAVKFTPEHGKVWVEARDCGSFVEICVEDTGIGISEEVLVQMGRNAYYTTKGTADEMGTGLGLLLCREFLAKNGSKLSIESGEGKGSIFSFTLPVKNYKPAGAGPMV